MNTLLLSKFKTFIKALSLLQLHYLMNDHLRQVFPFYNYYPCLFYPPWPGLDYSQHQNPNFFPKKETTFQRPCPQQSQKTPEPLQEKVPSQKKQISKTRAKRRKEREEDYSRKHQKKDRNLPSNVFKILSTYVYNNSKMTSILRALTPPSVQIIPERILNKFKELIRVDQSYIRPATIQSLCSGCQLSEGESLVFRIFIRKFLMVEFPVIIAQQPKLRKSQKTAYVRLARCLERQLETKSFT